jgi:hypothetical protein
MPLPGTSPIHPRWSQHHRSTATAALRGTCTITRPAPPASYNDVTMQYTSGTPTTVYEGPCRVQALAAADARVRFGGQDVALRQYLVVVRAETAVEVDDVVTVTAAADDPTLVGRRLRVLDVTRGTETWERDLLCQDWQG